MRVRPVSVADLLAIRRTERDALVERASASLQSDERVLAAWLTGSLGRGGSDDLSDIDLWVAFADEASGAIQAGRRKFVECLGTPLLIEEAPQNAPPGGAYLLVLYEGDAGPQQVDWYWQPRTGAGVPANARLLFDRTGIPRLPPRRLTRDERVAAAAQEVVFFWAMANITAKNVARRQSWATVSMLSALVRILQNLRLLLDPAGGGPVYKDTRTTPPPLQPAEQAAALRELAHEMEALMPRAVELGARVPLDAIPQIYRFFNLAEAMIEEAPNESE